MSRKKSRPKQPSARGHVEGNVIRLKLKQELIRVDKDGNPIQNNSMPVNVMSKNWLTDRLLDPNVSGPPKIVTRNPPPDNVTSITKAKKPETSKPVSQSGNEAEVVHTTSGNKHGWLHDKPSAMAEFSSWSRITKELGRSRCGSEPWVKDEKGKLSSPSLELQRERSKQGHSKLKFKAPPSTVSNPFIKPEAPHGGYAPNNRAQPICVLNQRNRARYGVDEAEPVSPSGIPIREFVTGKYKPKSSVVSTALPPTANKHWGASNDEKYEILANSWAKKTSGMVQWFINHVEPQNWPTHIHNFVMWRNDGPLVNTGAINKACSHPETELLLLKSMNEGLEKDWRMLDSALTDSQSENNLLRQELELTKQELASERQANSLMEYDLSHRQGIPPDEVRDSYVIKSKPPQVPDDVDTMLFQYRMYRSFERMQSPEEAFARFVYNDPGLGIVMREHADMLCEQRQASVEYRNLIRFIKQLSEHIDSTQRAEYEQLWTKEYPKYRRVLNRRHISAVRNPAREGVALAAIARKGKPATQRSSTYYSTLHDRSSYLTSAVAKAIIQRVKPTRPVYNNPRLVEHDTRESWVQPRFRGIGKYEQWWAERLDYCEVRYHEVKHPIKVGVVKAYNKLVDVLNKPVDPATRRKHAHLREQMKLKQRELNEKREQRKEERVAAKKRKAEREHIRKMQRIAH